MDDDAWTAEVLRVYWNRYDEARNAGLTDIEAHRYARSDADVGVLRRLVKLHVSGRLIARIVL